VLVANALSKAYGKGEPVIADVSLELASDETITIVGPSGAGKTTLLYMLCGLVPPDHGSVKLDGQPVQSGSSKIAIILQDYGLLPWKTVLENVTLGLKIQGVGRAIRRQRALEILAELGLAGRDHDYPAQLSGGEQQRVAIGRALATQPKLFLMDEPFSSLDAITREKLQLGLLATWKSNRIPYVLVTHSVPEAVLLGRRILILAGKPASIVSSFDNPGFGVPEYRHKEAFYELIRTVRHRMEHYW
jgi:ABC-type nitrate/sulfonate/bicarbonate transport system ATPase subunit